MNLPHRPAVDDDEARARGRASLARMAALLSLTVFVLALAGLHVWADRIDGRPLAAAAPAAGAEPEPIRTDGASLAPGLTEHEQQAAYMTHGG